MSRGMGKGDERVNDAIEDAMNSPLLNNNDVFSAKKILINISCSEEHPLMMEEMNALHDFMGKFDHGIEVIWGSAVEEILGEEVKVTLLATGFSIKDIPGIKDRDEELSKAEELERKIREDQRKKDEEEDQKLIDKYYGASGVKMLSNASYNHEPFILSMDDLDNSELLDALEKNAVFKRERDFNPRTYKVENRTISPLFD